MYRKLKKAEEKYYAFIEEVEENIRQTNVSLKGKASAKSNLFLFLKPRETKVNTLANYNFRSKKNEIDINSRISMR